MNPTRILLVEDNPRDVRLVEIALSEADGFEHKLEVARSLTEGIARGKKGGLDLVLLDLGLPESLGTPTLVKFLQAVPDLPVVVLTGMSDEDIAIEAARMGAQDYLVKGHMRGDLLRRVFRYAVERHRTLLELRRALKAMAAETHVKGTQGR